MIRIGPAGWAYQDWNGIVYPARKPKGFHPVTYLARYFDAIEINSSYYGAPRADSAKRWAESVSGNSAFRFTAKLYRSFTHERKPAPNDERDFKDGIAPLLEAGRLGALLLQFPWSFKNSSENRDYLRKIHRRFREYPLVLEVRHSSWTEPEIMDMLGELEIAICNIDQPLYSKSVKPDAAATSGIGYIRLHGKNYRNWFSKTALSHERYDYLYSAEELEPWVGRVQEVAGKTKDTYVISNNHYVGKAVVNALEIGALLSGRAVAAPEPLIARYPEMAPFVKGSQSAFGETG